MQRGRGACKRGGNCHYGAAADCTNPTCRHEQSRKSWERSGWPQTPASESKGRGERPGDWPAACLRASEVACGAARDAHLQARAPGGAAVSCRAPQARMVGRSAAIVSQQAVV